MPYPREHAARLADPAKYDSFARQNDKGGAGIDFVFGVKDGKSEIQAIRFDASRFSTEEARAWLKAHDMDPIEFEPAAGEVEKAFFRLQVMAVKDGVASLGYAINPREPREEINVIKGAECTGVRAEVGDVLFCEVDSVEPVQVEKLWGVALFGVKPLSNLGARKPEHTKEILQKASDAKILKATDAVRDELSAIRFLKSEPHDRGFSIYCPLIKAEKAQVVYGVIMEPYDGTNKDLDGDYSSAEEIEKACHRYAEEFGLGTSYMHERRADEDIATVENFIAPTDYLVGGEKIRKGSWVIAQHVKSSAIWKEVESGKLTGFSINGLAGVGPVMKGAMQKRGPGGNLVNIRVEDISVVDKGANGKRYYLMKRSQIKENPVKKELAIALMKTTADAELRKQIVASVAEADRAEVEKAAQGSANDGHQAGADAVTLEVLKGVQAALKANTEAIAKMSPAAKPETPEERTARVTKLVAADQEIPEADLELATSIITKQAAEETEKPAPAADKDEE